MTTGTTRQGSVALPEQQPKHSYISKRVQEIPASGIRRYFDLLSSMADGISLGVGEPDFQTPEHISEAGVRAIQAGFTKYTSNYGLPELRAAVAEHLQNLYGVQYDPSNEIIITIGVSEALDIACRSILNPGDEVLIPNPGYVAYAPMVKLTGAEVVPVPTSVEDKFAVTAQNIAAQITPRTRAILLGFPNNPTGAVMPRGEVEKIVALAQQHDLLIISDEIYDRLVYNTEHVCVASIPGAKERTILLGGFSKAYAMTGWRIGYACAPAPILEAMMKVHQYSIMSAPTPSQYAGIEALRHGEPDVEVMVAEYDRRRRYIVKAFNEIGLPCYEPQGAFYAFPQVSQLGMSDTEFVERLLQEEHIVVVPGSAFGSCGDGYIRCCYATALPKIEEAIDRMSRFIKRHGG